MENTQSQSAGMLLPTEAAWLAGILDGEGAISWSHNEARRSGSKQQIKLWVNTTSPWLAAKLSRILQKLQTTYHYEFEPGHEGKTRPWKDRLGVVCGGSASVRKILEVTLPFLSEKREQAEVVLEYLTWRKQWANVPPAEFRKFVVEKQHEALAKLREIRSRQYDLQRLPRKASTELDLTKLSLKEVVV